MKRLLLSSSKRGFTLLEVMLAVLILGLVAIGIFRFVQGTLQAIRYSVEDAEESLSVERTVALIQEEMYALPTKGNTGFIVGTELRNQNRDFDTLEWQSKGGPGLMTTAATGQYRVTLMMKPVTATSREYEIGLRRRPVTVDSAGGLVQGGSDKDATWIPLLPKTDGLRIRFWDKNMNQFVAGWNNQAARPVFLVLSILKEGETVPYEAVLTIPAAMAEAQR